MKKTLAILISSAAVVLTGCGEMYKTHFWYSSPKSSVGKQCVHECWNKNYKCRNWSLDQNMTRSQTNLRCTNSFNTCYSDCGGKVYSTQSKWEEAHWQNCSADHGCPGRYQKMKGQYEKAN